MRKIYVCSDDVTGIFSAVYDAWREKDVESDQGIAIRGEIEPMLFCEYVETECSQRKVKAVEQMILKHMGEEVYRSLYFAALSQDRERGGAILGTLLAARKLKTPVRIMEHLGNPCVEKVFELNRNVGQEAHLLTGFLRFRELGSGILFAQITPKNNVIPILGNHFQLRFPLENWVIYDKNRELAAVHESGKRWIIAGTEGMDTGTLEKYSDKEEEIQRLWRGFCHAVSIEERKNPKCQRTNLPLWYRKNMTEFQKQPK